MMDAGHLPLVTVGVPVYNEASFLLSTLTSLLSQDYSELEILVCDNASTDGTAAIAEKLAAQDRRIHIHRNDRNRGALRNFHLPLQLARGKYFMWAGGHDTWTPSYIRKCTDALEKDPDAVLAYTDVVQVNYQGEQQEIPAPVMDPDVWPDDPVGRLKFFCYGAVRGTMIYGLARRELLTKCFVANPVYGTDLLCLLRLLMQGHMRKVTGEHFLRRLQRVNETFPDRLRRYYTSFFPEHERPPRWFPMAGFYRGFMTSILSPEMGPILKARMAAVALRWLTWHSYARWYLVQEILRWGAYR